MSNADDVRKKLHRLRLMIATAPETPPRAAPAAIVVRGWFNRIVVAAPPPDGDAPR